MARYEEHPSKATAWRDGRFVVLDGAQTANLTVWFATGLGGEDAEWEGLLAQRTGPAQARVCAVPFWLYDLDLGDEVKLVDSAEGAAVAERVVSTAGNVTFRVAFEEAESDDERWRELMFECEPYQCWFDVRSPAFIAISTSVEHAQSVADLLAAKESAGGLHYETGRSSVRAAEDPA